MLREDIILIEKKSLGCLKTKIGDEGVVEYMLYHATYKRYLDSIKRNGLLCQPPQHTWDISERGLIYLVDDAYEALCMCEAADVEDDEIIVFEIDAAKLDILKLKIDGNIREEDFPDITFWTYSADIDYDLLTPITVES
jgi:hypothetical protein